MRKLTTILVVVLAVCTQATAQTPEDLIAVHEAQLAAMNAHDIDTMMSYWADDATYDLVSSPPPVPVQYVRAGYAARFAARPDFHMTMGSVLAAGNVVVEEGMTVYTDVGTGVEVIIPHLSIYEFEGDKIKKVTSYNDKVGPMIARGEMPAPEMPELVPSVPVPDPEPTGLLPIEANAELIARWNSHDAALVAKMDSASSEIFVGPMATTLDRAAMAAINESYFEAFPDIQLEVVRVLDLANGWVLTELVSRGTHLGPFMSMPASGYPVEIRVVWLTHYDADGLVTKHSFYYDNLTLITQMTTAPWPLDGIWVSTIPTPLGNMVMTTAYIAQDAAKTQYSGSLEEINPLPLLVELYPDGGVTKWAGGQAVMVGRNKYEATYLGYSIKIVESDIGKMTEIVGLFTINAHFELLGPNLLQGQGTGSYYMAAQDADQDGFPDEGQEPVACLPWAWTGKRLTALPGCIPTPMPESGQ